MSIAEASTEIDRLPPHPPVESPGGTDLSFRPDIEGLRAVAVIAVVVYHVHASWLRGGFVGVDVFFVISGFLITGLLLKEASIRGTVSILGFYARRARRILPAAMTVIIITVLASYLIQNFGAYGFVAQDGKWASLFATNFHFWLVGIDYARLGTAPSPLLHYWSLAVEEQFYLAWPLVFLALAVSNRIGLITSRAIQIMTVVSLSAVSVFMIVAQFEWNFKMGWLVIAWFVALAVRHHRVQSPKILGSLLVALSALSVLEIVWDFRSVLLVGLIFATLWRNLDFKWRILLVATVGVVVSFIWSVQQTTSYPQWAYFSPFTRAWELGIGAVVAVIAPNLKKLDHKIGMAVAWLGLASIVYSAWRFGNVSNFPGSEALWPVLGAAAIIVGGSSGTGAGHLLGLRPIRSIGRVSYGWYLLHYPFMIILTGPIFLHQLSAGENSVIAIVTLALAYVMYWSLERPIRRSVYLARNPVVSLALGQQFVLGAFLLCLILTPTIHSLWLSNILP